MADWHVEHASWAIDAAALQALRHQVFIVEQAVPAEEEWDGLDPACDHVLARAGDSAPIGCGRVAPKGRIGRMAVLAPWRRRGVGSALLLALVERCRERGWLEVTLHAQVRALDFYAAHGFVATGPRFMEAGIEHQAMQRQLRPLEPPPAVRGVAPPAPVAQRLDCSGPADLRAATLRLLAEARHRIRLRSPLLAPLLPDDEELVAELRRIATSGRTAALDILLHDADAVLQTGHRLVSLAQRLESAVHVRVVSEPEDLAWPSAFLVTDRGGYLFQARAEVARATGSTQAPGRARTLAGDFDAAWHRAVPASAWRRLDL